MIAAIATLTVLNMTLGNGCVCSPFSGNPDGCCTAPSAGKPATCHSDFSSAPCGDGATPQYCCNSNFESHCCETSACTAGCRNSLEGGCGCKAEPTQESVGYSETVAIRMLAFNAASQCAAGAITPWTCTACLNDTRLIDVNVTSVDGHLAYVGYDALFDKIVVVFRGSMSVQDWADNLDAIKVPAYAELGCTGCNVHFGFFTAFQSLQPGVEASVLWLLRRYPATGGIALTGHSLGAAMATHSAVSLRLVHNLTLEQQVYTFGQPRVGDAAFAAWHGAHFPGWLRVTHWNDPVPHLPPLDWGFAHEAREIWYDETSDAAVVCDGSGEDKDCSLSVALAVVFDDHCSYLGHHNCQCVVF